MSLIINYIETVNADATLLEIYRELRGYFQILGWSEEDLENPPYYTAEMFSANERFQRAKMRLRDELKSFFGDMYSDVEYNDYIMAKLTQIDKETPLSKKGVKRKKDDLWQ